MRESDLTRVAKRGLSTAGSSSLVEPLDDPASGSFINDCEVRFDILWQMASRSVHET